MNTNDKHILLFESCRLVKGYNRTCLVDVQRLKIELLDNEIFRIFEKSNLTKSISAILNEYDHNDQSVISEYFTFLIENEYAFECNKDEVKFFSKMDLTFDIPAKISNCIIDFKEIPDNLYFYKNFIHDLDKVGCENIQLRVFDNNSLAKLPELLMLFDQTIIYRVELLIKHNKNNKDIESLLSGKTDI
jgi:hypothetical protein